MGENESEGRRAVRRSMVLLLTRGEDERSQCRSRGGGLAEAKSEGDQDAIFSRIGE
jgi:hypothetical protein